MKERKSSIYKSFVMKAVDSEGGGPHFEGYLSTYENEDRDGDIVEKGAFDESIAKKAVVPMCFNHNRSQVLGKLELSSDDKGLYVKGFFDEEDEFAAGIRRKMKMGALDSMSIGMYVKEFVSLDANEPWWGWRITKADVLEGSVVTTPANEEATVVSVKNLDDEERQELQTLRKEKRAQKIQDILNTGKSLLAERGNQ